MGTEKGIRLFAVVGLIAVLAGCASHENPGRGSVAAQSGLGGSKWGYYSGDPILKWNPDGRTMTVMTELSYTDPHGVIWDAPAGSVTDGASIPRYLWSLIGGPFGGFLVHHFGEVRHQPAMIWWSVTAIGLATAAVLWIYDRIVRHMMAA